MKKKRPAQYRASSATPVGMAATLEPSRSTAVRQQKSPNKWKEIRFQTFQILRRRAICFAHLISYPRHLPFCVAARQHLDPRPGDIRIKRSRKHGHQLGNAERFHRRKRGIEAACRERPHLLERAALLQHPVETGLDAGVEPGAIGEKREMQPRPFEDAPRGCPPLPVGERHARLLDHLECAQKSLRIANIEARGHLGILRDQHRVDDLVPRLALQFPEPVPHVFRDLGNFRNAISQDIEIKPGAADNDGKFPRRLCRPDLVQRHIAPARGVAVIGRIEDAIKPVRHAGLFACARTRSQNAKAAVNLHAVRIDDDTVKFLCYGNGERGFAARGRPCKKDCARLPAFRRHVVIHQGLLPRTMIQNSVLTLVADHTAGTALRNLSETARRVLANAGAAVDGPDWLKDDHAVDLPFGGLALDAAKAAIEAAALPAGVDYCVQEAEGRRKKLFLADMDSTMITIECIDELADFAGLKAEVSAITEQAMQGKLEFTDAFRARVKMLTGLREEVLQQVYDERVVMTAGARTLVQTLRANGCYTALVSGGFTFFTSRVREALGFHMDMSNELLFENGTLTGAAKEPILNSAAKLATLERLIVEKNIPRRETLAIGDGANDIPMIEAAGLGVAFHAKEKAAKAADANIRYGDLTTLLYFQGYRESDFVG